MWHRKTAVRLITAFVLGSLCACTTPAQRQTAVERVNSVWAADNQDIRSKLASRRVTASPEQSMQAAELALRRIGLEDVNTDRKAGLATSKRQYSNAAWSWSDAVKQAEEPRLRQIFVDAIGPQGAFLALDPKDEILSATVKVAASGKKNLAVVTIDFRSDTAGGASCAGGCVVEIPPAALRAGLYEFWQAFDSELTDLQTKARQTRKTKVPAQQQPAKQNRSPNEWVVPPKSWVLPSSH